MIDIQIEKSFHDIFWYADKNKCSDIHLNSLETVSFRFDGKIVKAPELFQRYTADEILRLAFQLNPDLNIGAKPLNHAIDFSCTYDNLRIRCNLFPTIDGLSLSIRLFPDKIPSLTDLRCPKGVLKLITDFSHGLVLVSGPTGSGKSTTLAAMLDHINKNEAKRIITIEDPVEYIHQSDKSVITHRQVGKNCDTFYEGFKDSLREDPDIIFIGEIRDMETMKLAMEAAESGHLVLSTLHSSDVNESLNRIIGMFPSSMSEVVANQLSISLAGIIAQKLIKARNGGRVAAYEVLINNPTIANIIRNNDMRHLGDYMRPEQGMVKFSDYLAGMRNKKIIVD